MSAFSGVAGLKVRHVHPDGTEHAHEGGWDAHKHARCLDAHGGGCKGPVEYRESLSGTGRSIARCDAHWSLRLAEHEKHRAIYPDSPTPPAWFDPTLAGEVWDDE